MLYLKAEPRYLIVNIDISFKKENIVEKEAIFQLSLFFYAFSKKHHFKLMFYSLYYVRKSVNLKCSSLFIYLLTDYVILVLKDVPFTSREIKENISRNQYGKRGKRS